MEISPVSNTAAATTESKISADFDTFLKMMTAQIKNQDPLNPMDASDFSTQLATFSGVEQQVLTNDLLRDLASSLGGNDLTALSNWVGKEIAIPNDFTLDDNTVSLQFSVPASAEYAMVLIQDDIGQTIAQFPVTPQDSEIVWNGERSDGMIAAQGSYRATLVPIAQDMEMPEVPVFTYQKVREIRLDQGTAKLVTIDGSAYALSTVNALRDG